MTHDLKKQFPSNADLRDESEVFYEFHTRASRDYPAFDDRAITTNDEETCSSPAPPMREQSTLARNVRRKVSTVERDLARIQPGWFHVGRKWDVPRCVCHVGCYKNVYAWVDSDGLDAFTEFTLTVMKISELIKETQTLISPGSAKFSPGAR